MNKIIKLNIFIIFVYSVLISQSYAGQYNVVECKENNLNCYRDQEVTVCDDFFSVLDSFPTTNGYKWYRGVTHDHSNASDQSLSLKGPYYVANLYRKLGYDWVMISDHNHFTHVNNYTDKCPDDAICPDDPNNPGTKMNNQQYLKYLNTQRGRTDGFLVIEGEEIGKNQSQGSKHVTGFNLIYQQELNDANAIANNTLQQNINLAYNNNVNNNEHDSLAFVNHPQMSKVTDEILLSLNHVWYTEINKPHDRKVMDSANTRRILNTNENWPWYDGIASDDSHSEDNDPNDCINHRAGKKWIVVKLPIPEANNTNLTEMNIKTAIWQDSYYSSSGVILDYNPYENSGTLFEVKALNSTHYRIIKGKSMGNGKVRRSITSWKDMPVDNIASYLFPSGGGGVTYVRFEFVNDFNIKTTGYNKLKPQAWTNIFYYNQNP